MHDISKIIPIVRRAEKTTWYVRLNMAFYRHIKALDEGDEIAEFKWSWVERKCREKLKEYC